MVLVGIDVSGNVKELSAPAAILLATVGYAIGPMVVKHRLRDLDPRATMGASLAIASLILLAPAIADPPAFRADGRRDRRRGVPRAACAPPWRS